MGVGNVRADMRSPRRKSASKEVLLRMASELHVSIEFKGSWVYMGGEAYTRDKLYGKLYRMKRQG